MPGVRIEKKALRTPLQRRSNVMVAGHSAALPATSAPITISMCMRQMPALEILDCEGSTSLNSGMAAPCSAMTARNSSAMTSQLRSRVSAPSGKCTALSRNGVVPRGMNWLTPASMRNGPLRTSWSTK